MNTEKSISILHTVASTINHDRFGKFVPEESTRLNIIKKLLKGTDYKVLDKDLFVLCSKRPIKEISGPITVISSHIDTHRKITAPFSDESDDKKLRGTYDNSITNAAIITLMLENQLPENVVIVFTGNEEYGMKGAIDFCEFAKEEGIQARVIAADVTGRGYKSEKSFTMENKGNCGAWMRKVKEAFGNSPYDWKDKKGYEEDDEACIYRDYGYESFSLCIPTKGEMHDNTGLTVRRKTYFDYTDALCIAANL
ncbi:MAG: M20/M25/M40 family metallo-hydrolase [Lachnospiraceae bacterium]|nr:M20/M25/M40 family metallo-hydrolase [Lachnospiraceae bacterium]